MQKLVTVNIIFIISFHVQQTTNQFNFVFDQKRIKKNKKQQQQLI
jgi:hypothetical protein